MSTALEIPATEAPYAVAPAERPPVNTLAAIALALSFVTIVGGIVCGHVALSQIRQTGERGRGLAIAALVISYGAIALGVLYVAGMIALVLGTSIASS